MCGDNSTGDLLGLLASSRALESSAKVARKLPFILFSLSLLGYFSRTNLLLPCVQLPFYNLPCTESGFAGCAPLDSCGSCCCC